MVGYGSVPHSAASLQPKSLLFFVVPQRTVLQSIFQYSSFCFSLLSRCWFEISIKTLMQDLWRTKEPKNELWKIALCMALIGGSCLSPGSQSERANITVKGFLRLHRPQTYYFSVCHSLILDLCKLRVHKAWETKRNRRRSAKIKWLCKRGIGINSNSSGDQKGREITSRRRKPIEPNVHQRMVQATDI